MKALKTIKNILMGILGTAFYLFALVMTVLLLSACSLSNTPSGKVEAFLNEYTSISDSVKADMETKVESENLSEENKKVYLDVLTRQYKNLKYSIKDESIDGNKATVKAKVTVYDLYKVDKDSVNYMNNNSTEFIDENGADLEYDITALSAVTAVRTTLGNIFFPP